MPPRSITVSTQSRKMARGVVALLEHVSRAIHARSFTHGLNPAQWNALRYLAEANPSARTVTAFAAHHLTSKAAASDTLNALVAKGLVVKARDAEDARVQVLSLTRAGSDILADDPLEPLHQALAERPIDDLEQLALSLAETIRNLYPRSA